MSDHVAIRREPWLGSLLAAAQRESASLVTGRGTDRKVEGILSLVRENQALLAKAQGISTREVGQLRAELESSRVAGRALETSLQSLVNEVRLVVRPVGEVAREAPSYSEVLTKMENLCREIECYEVRFGREPSQERREKWLIKVEDALFQLSSSPFQAISVFDEARLKWLVEQGNLTGAQHSVLRNEPVSSQLLSVYLSLRRACPTYDRRQIQLGRIKAMFIGPEALDRLSADYFKKVHEKLSPFALKVTQQIGKELVEKIWAKRRSTRGYAATLVHKELYDQLFAHQQAHQWCRSSCIESILEHRAFIHREKSLFVDIGLSLPELIDNIRTRKMLPLQFPQVMGEEGEPPISVQLGMVGSITPELFIAQSLGVGYFERTYEMVEPEEDSPAKAIIYEHFVLGEERWTVMREKLRLPTEPVVPWLIECVPVTVHPYADDPTSAWGIAMMNKLKMMDSKSVLSDQGAKDSASIYALIEELKESLTKIMPLGTPDPMKIKDSEWPEELKGYVWIYSDRSFGLSLRSKFRWTIIMAEILEKVALQDKLQVLREEAAKRLEQDPEFSAAVAELKEEWEKLSQMATYFGMSLEASRIEAAYRGCLNPMEPFFSELKRESYPTFVDRRFEL